MKNMKNQRANSGRAKRYDALQPVLSLREDSEAVNSLQREPTTRGRNKTAGSDPAERKKRRSNEMKNAATK